MVAPRRPRRMTLHGSRCEDARRRARLRPSARPARRCCEVRGGPQHGPREPRETPAPHDEVEETEQPSPDQQFDVVGSTRPIRRARAGEDDRASLTPSRTPRLDPFGRPPQADWWHQGTIPACCAKARGERRRCSARHQEDDGIRYRGYTYTRLNCFLVKRMALKPSLRSGEITRVRLRICLPRNDAGEPGEVLEEWRRRHLPLKEHAPCTLAVAERLFLEGQGLALESP